MEDETRRQKHLLQTTFDSLGDAVFILDAKAPPTILGCNKAASQIFGYERAEMLGRDTSFLHVSEETLKEFQSLLYPAVEKGRVPFHLSEFRMKRKDGSVFPSEHTVSQLLDEEGRRTGWVSIVKDNSRLKRIEETLRESEEDLKNLVEEAPVGLIDTDLVGTVTYVNKRFEEVSGYSREEVVGRNGFELGMFSDETLKILLQRMGELLRGEPSGSREVQFKCKDGRWIWVEIKGRLIKRLGRPVGFQIIADDITTRVELLENTKAAEKRHRDLLEASMDAVAVAVRTRLVYANRSAAELFGFSDPSQLVGREYPEMIAPDDRDLVTSRSLRRQRGEEAPPRYEFRIQRSDGTLRHVETQATLIDWEGRPAVLAFMRDVTERRRMEDELKASEERYRSLVESSPDAISVTVGSEIVYANQKRAELAGLDDPSQLIGTSALDFIDPRDKEAILKKIRARQEGEEVQPLSEFRIRRTDGAVRDIVSYDSPIEFSGRRAVLHFLHDVTDEKRLNEQIKAHTEQLEKLVEEKTRRLREAERLAVTGEVAAMVGHDLRNPLQAISNTLYLTGKELDSLPLQPEQKQITARRQKTILRQVEYMNKIVSDLQEYSRQFKPQLVETSLPQLVNEVLSTIAVPEHVKVSKVVGEGFPKLMVDADLMNRALTNLVRNALEAMPNGGQLTIEACETSEGALISVRDTGVGISQENIDKCFQPLFTTKAKGIGFGLAICKRIVEAHDGRITVESELGKGSTFTLGIPLKRR